MNLFWDGAVHRKATPLDRNRRRSYRKTLKKPQGARFWAGFSCDGTPIAMSVVRDAPCPALTQATAMPAKSDSRSSSRALVRLAPERTQAHRAVERTPNFLAHLLATRLQLPQARERRRAEPDEVIAAYRATMARLRAQ